MKRLHVHISVDSLSDSIKFYSGMFAAEPTMVKEDYAKWMLDDPRVNFAISKRGRAVGLDHMGIQAENADELHEIEQRIQSAELPHLPQQNTSCCYAKSDKHWSVDPNGIAWEAFHTLDSIPNFGKDTLNAAKDAVKVDTSSACCIPLSPTTAIKEKSACCVPTSSSKDKSSCC